MRDWPKGIQLYHDKMYLNQRLCVPADIADIVMAAHHLVSGHCGTNKLMKSLITRYEFASDFPVEDMAKGVRAGCLVCQVAEPSTRRAKGIIEMNLVPDKIMSHVCLDVFSLPTTMFEGKTYDALVLCVDRLSGWIIARPTLHKGLTAELASHLLLQGGWETFGIPSHITCDQGPQFAGQYLRTMCARLGIRLAYSQAYRPQANGRAEVAGKTIKGLLRKLHIEEGGINWVEALPRALYVYHNTEGVSGYSPFQTVFGRERNEPGLPTLPLRECETASHFFSRMEEMDQKIAGVLNKTHQSEQERYNRNLSARPAFKEGETVWFLRPKGVGGAKLDSWWIGPCKVTARKGASSY